MAWTEQTSLGVTPEEAFSSLAGSCSAPLSWDASGFDGPVFASEPPTGQTQVHVEVELDQDSARITEPGEDAGEGSCERVFSIEGHVRFRTDDEVLVDESDVTIFYGSLMRFERAPDVVGGRPVLAEGAELSIELDGAGENCAGTVSIRQTSSMGHVATSSQGRVGTWSASGCAPGEQPRELEELSRARIDEALGDVRLDGTWADGTRSTITLVASLAGTRACSSWLGLELPLDVRYGTEDGVIETHDARTTLHLDPPGASEGFGFGVDEARACEDETDDTLPYTRADCGVVTDIIISFTLRSNNGVLIAGDDGLNVYENLRRAAADGDSQRTTNFGFDAKEYDATE